MHIGQLIRRDGEVYQRHVEHDRQRLGDEAGHDLAETYAHKYLVHAHVLSEHEGRGTFRYERMLELNFAKPNMAKYFGRNPQGGGQSSEIGGVLPVSEVIVEASR